MGWVVRASILTIFTSLAATSGFAVASTPVSASEQCGNNRANAPEDNNLHRQLDSEDTLPELQNASVVSIELKQLNVFDTSLPEEDNAVFRFANRAHITTKPEVIRNLLLFTQGGEYDPKLLRESERLLRQQPYIYDARIFAEQTCDGEVAVTVVTRDLWTLLPDISFSRSGGDNSSRLGFRESNLLGYGKRLSLTHISDPDRSGYLFVYDDPQILSSRYQGRLEYADNDDGKVHYVGVEYPFFSIATPYSYGVSNLSNRRVESFYNLGEEISEYEQLSEVSNLYIGRSFALNNDWTRRLLLGYRDEKQEFARLRDTTLPIAEDRTLRYPYIQAQWFEDAYIKVRNFDSIYRTEDLNLGWNINALLGYSDKELSDDDSRWVMSFNANKAHFTSQNSLLRFAFNLHGYWNKRQSEAENLLLSSRVQYYLNTSLRQSWYAQLEVQYGKHLSADQQITLGGETGLRGYPSNYLQGNRRILLNLEKRYYWEYDLLQLFKVGGAAYFDIGRVDGRPLAPPLAGALDDPHSLTPEQQYALTNQIQGQFLKNIGLGLRLAPSRANSGLVLHLDVATPLDGPDNIDSVQWLFTVKNRF
ncbi:ShlB/FhaC/HecB family hemolysin secretion/activation protein [Pseudoalteromonas rubra]|uniref:ShlB/FhaC/HecB family hemolysin secretion/activation protein n=1 Tax=Pseudoalteromonas rubra TaxID=43658 RepID=UPI000697DC07|nr:ShlB/FhaC/HecB family hemolysin secretion/activation protein [Pseudoalteromonas rubra]